MEDVTLRPSVRYPTLVNTQQQEGYTMDITNLSLNSLNNHYAIELARVIVDRCVEKNMLTQLQGMLVFDSLVDGLNRRPIAELNDMLLQLNNNMEVTNERI